MPVPWMTILDAVLGVTDIARRARRRSLGATEVGLSTFGARGLGSLEARLAGVVVSALKEAFNRDHQRLELERATLAAERRRAERMLRLELARQGSDRETGRQRLVAGAAAFAWLGSLFFSAGLIDGATSGARGSFGAGWLLLLGALAASFVAQSRLADAMDRLARQSVAEAADDGLSPWDDGRAGVDTVDDFEPVSSGTAGALAPWLLVAGLVLIALGVLLM